MIFINTSIVKNTVKVRLILFIAIFKELFGSNSGWSTASIIEEHIMITKTKQKMLNT